MRLDGTPRLRTRSISALDAQSNPVPNFARRRRSSLSGLHLTAELHLVGCPEQTQNLLTIEWLDQAQIYFPAEMLTVDLS